MCIFKGATSFTIHMPLEYQQTKLSHCTTHLFAITLKNIFPSSLLLCTTVMCVVFVVVGVIVTITGWVAAHYLLKMPFTTATCRGVEYSLICMQDLIEMSDRERERERKRAREWKKPTDSQWKWAKQMIKIRVNDKLSCVVGQRIFPYRHKGVCLCS